MVINSTSVHIEMNLIQYVFAFLFSEMTTVPTGNSSIGDPLGRGNVQIGLEVFISTSICLLSFLGNLLVVYAIHTDSRLHTITNMLIESLAFSDILMAVFHMPFWIISLRYGKWVLGHVICEIVGVTQLIFGIVSLLTMTVIALNRYFKVVKRQLYTRFFSNKKTTYIVIALCWFLSVLVNSPQLYGWGNITYHVFFTDCTCEWKRKDISYILFLCITTIFIPATIIFSCYFMIYRTVRASSRRVQGHSMLANYGKALEEKSEVAVLKTSLTVVCVYMLCWTPISVIGFMEAFGKESPRLAYLISYVLAYCSNMTNPFIYGLMNPQFKRAFAIILRLRESSEVVMTLPRSQVLNSQVDFTGTYTVKA